LRAKTSADRAWTKNERRPGARVSGEFGFDLIAELNGQRVAVERKRAG
jgi:hypothetical protein